MVLSFAPLGKSQGPRRSARVIDRHASARQPAPATHRLDDHIRVPGVADPDAALLAIGSGNLLSDAEPQVPHTVHRIGCAQV